MVKYSLEYKVHGAPWEDAEVMETNDTYMSIAKYGESYIYEVRIRAGNVFGCGSASKIRLIYFAGNRSNSDDLVFDIARHWIPRSFGG